MTSALCIRYAVGPCNLPLLLAPDRELTNPNARLLQDDDAAPQQRVLDRGEIGEQELCLHLVASIASASKQNDGGRVSLLNASRVPKSVSAETTTRSSAAALAMISSSTDACIP